MGTQVKTTEREASQYRQTSARDDRSTHQGHLQEEETNEFDDDRNQKLEGYDENEYDAANRRKRREAEEADGDTAAHERMEVRTPSRRGFAAMDKEKQRMIASKGGKASHGGGRKPSKNR